MAEPGERRRTAALLVASTLLVTCSIAVVLRSHGRITLPPTARVPAPPPRLRSVIELVDFLPRGFVLDGTIEYTEAVQRAVDAAAGRILLLPPFPVLVSARPGKLWCVRISKPIAIEGCPAAVLREKNGRAIILYAERTAGLRFEGFTLEGCGGDGIGLGHGLLQVTSCEDVLVRGVIVRNSDADGIAIAASKDVRVLDCDAQECSKAALYVNDCTNVVLQGNATLGGGGHLVPGGGAVGAAIQLSGNENLVCSGNTLSGGTGIGILCNSLPGRPKPEGNVLTANRIVGFHNPTNLNVSGGIRCENSNDESDTHTLIASNSIRDCGCFGIFLEHHDGALIADNTIAEAEWSAILISSANDVLVEGNLILNAGTALLPGKGALHLLNGASRIVARGNRFISAEGYAPGSASNWALDASGGSGNDLEAAFRYAPGPPLGEAWRQGSLTWNTTPLPGSPLGWVCVASGSPGTWVPFGNVP